jgi:hypothetical protein
MIAIYYVKNSSPNHLYTVEVMDFSPESIKEAIDSEELPYPDSEVLVLHGRYAKHVEFPW